MTKRVLFSFDYELFLGANSGTAEECLIHPTQKLMKILRRKKIRGIFFVDTMYLMRLKQEVVQHKKAQEDYLKVVEQLKALYKERNYLFIHLHPHWLDAVYRPDSNTWDLSDTTRYRISSIPLEQKSRLFKDSLGLLCEITGSNDTNQFNGYRAGGWSITPFSDFLPLFAENNIKYDFTVIPGKYFHSNVQSYDFRIAPEKSVYRFEEDICIENPGGRFFQFPVSVFEISKIWNRAYILYEKIKHVTLRTLRLEKQKGITAKTVVISSGDADKHAGKIRIPAQFENLNLFTFASMYKHFLKTGHLHSVSHPKMFKRWDYFYIRLFLFMAMASGRIQSDFINMD